MKVLLVLLNLLLAVDAPNLRMSNGKVDGKLVSDSFEAGLLVLLE